MTVADLISQETKDKVDPLLRLKAKFAKIPPHVCLLLDTSSSMTLKLRSGKARIDMLREMAKNFTGVRRFQFNSICEEMTATQVVEDPTGGTELGGAFLYIKNHGILHCVLITDGEPNSEERALECSQGLRVDILYAGDDPAPPFLEALAKARKGKYANVSLEDLVSLVGKVQALLPAPKGAIEL